MKSPGSSDLDDKRTEDFSVLFDMLAARQYENAELFLIDTQHQAHERGETAWKAC